MQNYIPTFTDISNWEINHYSNTGGSRAKRVVIEPTSEDVYFFKGSKVTVDGEIKYPTEFWSEIASSKIGQYFGFNMLDYNIAFHKKSNQRIGCLSKSMIEYSENKLTEGKAYLTGLNPNYNPENDKKDYTFQFISNALKEFNLEEHLPKLVEVIIFDALIGNSDRHQENWAFITYFKEAIEDMDKIFKNRNYLDRLLWQFLRPPLKNVRFLKEKKSIIKMQSNIANNTFSPIYESGCCLGREIIDSKVVEMLKNDQMIKSYLRKGKAEIHWKGLKGKQNHFELVKLLQEDFREIVANTIKRIKEKFSFNSISAIINNIDNKLPKELSNFKLSEQRKNLMIKLVTSRAQKLIELL